MKLQHTNYLIIYALLLTACTSIYARNLNVSGRVVGKYDGEPIIIHNGNVIIPDEYNILTVWKPDVTFTVYKLR